MALIAVAAPWRSSGGKIEGVRVLLPPLFLPPVINNYFQPGDPQDLTQRL